jgi:type I restriction enzyme S subunit
VFYGLGSGLRQNLDWNDFKYLPCLVPPLGEQTAIVRFLDQLDRRVRRYIRAKQKVVKLLEEQRRAIIHSVVTRGLDPNVHFKSSGIQWLEDMPEHWTLRRLKRLSPRISGRLVYQPAQYFVDEGVPFLMGNNITADGIRWTGVKRIPASVNQRFSHHALREGDVVTVRVGAPGVSCVIPPEAEGLNCGSLMIIRRSLAFNSHWLAYVMNSRIIKTQIAHVQYGAAQEQINIEDATNFVVPVPPLDEQAAIVEAIAQAIAPLREQIDRDRRSVGIVQELRTRVVADVVTGKLDVREAAALLPDEIKDPEAIDVTEADLDAAEGAEDLDALPEEAEA